MMPQKKWNRELIIGRIRSWHEAGVPTGKLYLQDRAMASSARTVFGSWRAALRAAGLESEQQVWTRGRVIRELKQCHRERQSINSKLGSAAVRHFGTINAARTVAGLPLARKKPATHDWDESKVILAIQDRNKSGGNTALSCTFREDSALYGAAKRFFGTWKAARRAAGHPSRHAVVLPPEEVINRIRNLHRSGRSLGNMQNKDQLLYRSARRAFGTWCNALREAGLKTPRRWSRHKVVAGILARKHAGLAVHRTWIEDKPLFRAALTHFGGWTPAMHAAGLTPIHRERWTKQRVIERLHAWEEKFGKGNIRVSDPNLAAAAARLFGSFSKALRAADIPHVSRRWTTARVIAQIQDRYVNGGQRHVEGLGDIRLANASKRLFGSWAAAVEAAGLSGRIPIKQPLRRWTPKQVIVAIQAWHDSERRLPELSRADQSLYNAAKLHFGTWRNALHAAGFESEHRVWSKEAVIEEIRQRVESGLSLSSGHPLNRNLAAVSYRHFGSWKKAIRASGVLLNQAKRKGA